MSDITFNCSLYDEHEQVDESNIETIDWANKEKLENDKKVYFVLEEVEKDFKAKVDAAASEIV